MQSMLTVFLFSMLAGLSLASVFLGVAQAREDWPRLNALSKVLDTGWVVVLGVGMANILFARWPGSQVFTLSSWIVLLMVLATVVAIQAVLYMKAKSRGTDRTGHVQSAKPSRSRSAWLTPA